MNWMHGWIMNAGRCVGLCLGGLLLAGCFEVRSHVKIREDGSGMAVSEVIISERMMVALAESESSDSPVKAGEGIPFDEASLREQMGPDVEILKVEAEDLEDGSRRLRYAVEVPDMVAFINGEDNDQPGLGIKLVQLDDETAAVEFDGGIDAGGRGMNLELAQLYGLIKGMYVRIKVTLPTALSSETGTVGGDGRSITWVTDLRSREGLQRAQERETRLGGKPARAEFSFAGLGIDPESFAPDGAGTGLTRTEDPADAEGLRAEVAAITTSRSRQIADEAAVEKARFFSPGKDQLKIQVLLQWDEGAAPANYETPVLEELVTDTGEDLLPDRTPHSFRRDVKGGDRRAVVADITAGVPSREATSIRSLKGYIPVIAEIESSTITVQDPGSKAGDQPLEGEAFQQVGARLKKVDGQSVEIEVQGQAIEEAVLVKAGGERVEGRRSWSGFNETYTYSFRYEKPVEAGDALEITVRQAETARKVPFVAQNLPLP